MAEYVKKIELDFNAEYPAQTVFAKQLDESSRFLLIEPQIDGEKFDIRDCGAKLCAQNQDDTIFDVDGTVTDEGNILVDITQVIQYSGIMKCDVKLTYEDEILSSCLFYINVISAILATNKIKAYKGRIWSCLLRVKDDSGYYILVNGESLIFTLKDGETAIIQKNLTNSDYDENEDGYILSLTSSQTDIPAGTYSYYIDLCRSDSEFETVIPKSQFIVIEG